MLAGGRASRLPGKLFLAIEGEPLLARVVRGLAHPERALFVVTNAELEPEVRATLAEVAPDARYVLDRERYAGPLVAIAAAARAVAETGVPWFVAVAGDMPNAGFVLVRRLEAARDAAEATCEAVVAIDGGGRTHPLAALYRAAAVSRAGEPLVASGERSLGALVRALGAIECTVGDVDLVNINAPADVARGVPARSDERLSADATP